MWAPTIRNVNSHIFKLIVCSVCMSAVCLCMRVLVKKKKRKKQSFVMIKKASISNICCSHLIISWEFHFFSLMCTVNECDFLYRREQCDGLRWRSHHIFMYSHWAERWTFCQMRVFTYTMFPKWLKNKTST